MKTRKIVPEKFQKTQKLIDSLHELGFDVNVIYDEEMNSNITIEIIGQFGLVKIMTFCDGAYSSGFTSYDV